MSNWKSTTAQKIAWLHAHPEFAGDLAPSASRETRDAAMKRAVAGMKRDGLISKSTGWRDVLHPVRANGLPPLPPSSTLTIRAMPCAACPYRKDAPPGLWHDNEYLKLPEYDRETALQPVGMFLCHDGDRQSVLCRGWCEVHGKQEHERDLLAVRFAASMGRIDPAEFPVTPCGVPMHESGEAAREAGMRPRDERTVRLAEKLITRHSELTEA